MSSRKKNYEKTDVLFSKDVWNGLVEKNVQKNIINSSGFRSVLNHLLCEKLSFTGKYEMPVVHAVNADIPKRIMALPRAEKFHVKDCAVHFYIEDVKFDEIWTHPYQGIRCLRKYPLVLGPDFSVYENLLFAQKVFNIYRNKLITAWWQYNGINVVPNISFPSEIESDIIYDGWPLHSMIAISSIGVKRSDRCVYKWLDRYNQTIEMLQPTHLLRYGPKIAGEREDISTYFENDNKILSEYGWQLCI